MAKQDAEPRARERFARKRAEEGMSMSEGHSSTKTPDVTEQPRSAERVAIDALLNVLNNWERQMSEDDPRIVNRIRLSEACDQELIHALKAAVTDNNMSRRIATSALYFLGCGAFVEEVLTVFDALPR